MAAIPSAKGSTTCAEPSTARLSSELLGRLFVAVTPHEPKLREEIGSGVNLRLSAANGPNAAPLFCVDADEMVPRLLKDDVLLSVLDRPSQTELFMARLHELLSAELLRNIVMRPGQRVLCFTGYPHVVEYLKRGGLNPDHIWVYGEASLLSTLQRRGYESIREYKQAVVDRIVDELSTTT